MTSLEVSWFAEAGMDLHFNRGMAWQIDLRIGVGDFLPS